MGWMIPPRSGRPPLISHKTLQKIEQEFKRISDHMTPKKLNNSYFTEHISYYSRASFIAQMESKSKGSTETTCTRSI